MKDSGFPTRLTWAFTAALLLQTGLILAIPARSAYTYITGKTVILQTAPVDPYDFLRGYYQTLNYEISNTNNLKNLPGWNKLEVSKESPEWVSKNTPIYLILEAPKNTETSNQKTPEAWQPVEIRLERPSNLPENQIALEGMTRYSSVEYGLETYYMPENERDNINQQIQTLQQNIKPGEKQAFLVEIKVGKDGKSLPISLWIGDQNYRF